MRSFARVQQRCAIRRVPQRRRKELAQLHGRLVRRALSSATGLSRARRPSWTVAKSCRCSAKSLQRPGMARLLALVAAGAIDTVIIAKLDRLTRSGADLAELLKQFERRGVSIVSVADSLDTRLAAGRLVLNIMVSVSQWEREAIGERTLLTRFLSG